MDDISPNIEWVVAKLRKLQRDEGKRGMTEKTRERGRESGGGRRCGRHTVEVSSFCNLKSRL